MAAELIVAVVVIPFDCRLLDRTVYRFDLTVGPWMVGLGQAMFDTIGFADQIKPHLAKRDAVSVAWLLCELDAVIGENGVDFVGHGIKEIFKERPSCFAIGLFDHVRDRELAGAING